jgi:dCMP deaminase
MGDKVSNKWDNRFLELAKLISSWSKDTSTKVGAVIVDDVRNVRATGYNGIPRNLSDDVEERSERPTKYFWVEHAERNAVYAAARRGESLEGCTLYCNHSPCADCARAIIQSGIKTVVFPDGTDAPTGGMGETFMVALNMLREAGIEVRTHIIPPTLEEIQKISLGLIRTFDGKVWTGE